MEWLNKKIVIVTGKGGVGKSTVAATMAIQAAKSGKKALLVELGEESFYKPFFGLQTVSSQPQTVQPWGFDVALWDTESCLREYVLHYVKIEGILKLFFENKVMKTFINVAPALKELAILGKLTSGIRKVGPKFDYDIVILDGYATGHMLALIRAPKGMAESIRTGPMGVHSAAIYESITNPEITDFVIVTLPDELPVVESLELEKTLLTEFGIRARLVVNRFWQPPIGLESLHQLRSKVTSDGLSSFLKYLDHKLIRQDANVARIKKTQTLLPTLPLVFQKNAGSEVADHLASVVKL